MPGLLASRDFWSGVMLIAIGAASIVIASDYPLGTARRMGPGYFPILLGVMLALFGIFLVVQAFRRHDAIEGSWSPRALIVLPLSLVLFGVLMDRAGFIPALVVLIFGSAAGGTEFKLGEVSLLTLVLTIFAVVVFIWGLGLPYPLIAGF